MDTKNDVRKRLIDRRKALSAPEREAANREICRHMIHYMEQTNCLLCYFYYPQGSEADVRPAIEWALEHQRIVGLPKVTGDEMDFYQVQDLQRDLQPGAFGIMEPGAAEDRLLSGQQALCFVPGVGFDITGHRLGRGKGYYDKFLTDTKLHKVGIAYQCQLVETLPVETHDVPMEQIITEGGCLLTREDVG
jgi:5-formyltetrahydrofolate cyclo-ligase